MKPTLKAFALTVLAFTAFENVSLADCPNVAGLWVNGHGVQFRISQAGCSHFTLVDIDAPQAPTSYEIQTDSSRTPIPGPSRFAAHYRAAPLTESNQMPLRFEMPLDLRESPLLGGRIRELRMQIDTMVTLTENRITMSLDEIRFTDRSTLLRRAVSAGANLAMGLAMPYLRNVHTETLTRIGN
jgi:hypothetical protein